MGRGRKPEERSNILKQTFQASANKKPGPVLNEPWINAKSELYLFTNRIVRAVFGGGSQDPPKPPKPPGEIIAGFDDDEFKGRYIFIHPKKLNWFRRMEKMENKIMPY